MKKFIALIIGVAMVTGCSSITPEQREKIVDLVIKGVEVAEQVYIADAQTKPESYTVAAATNGDLAYQTALAVKLLKADGKQYSMKETGQTYETTLRHFLTKMIELAAEEKTTTPLRIKTATVKDGVIVDLMYSLLQEDGSLIDESCPSCVIWD